MIAKELCAHVRAAADLVWPPWCPDCGARIDRPADGFCEACWSALRPVRPGGAPLVPGAPAVIAAYSVDARFVRILGAAKYHGLRRVGLRLAREASARLRNRLPPGTLVPVPLAPEKRRERGFNQAEDFARELSGAHGRAWRPWLRRDRAGPALARLPREDRAAVIAGAYSAAPAFPGPGGGPVLLVDDVVTTGSTAREARAALGGGQGPVTAVVCLGRAFATVEDNLPPGPKVFERL